MSSTTARVAKTSFTRWNHRFASSTQPLFLRVRLVSPLPSHSRSSSAFSTWAIPPKNSAGSAAAVRRNRKPMLAMGPRRLEATAAMYDTHDNDLMTTTTTTTSGQDSNDKRQRDCEYESDLVVVLDMDECLIHSQFMSRDAAKHAHQATSSNGLYSWNDNTVESFLITLPDGSAVKVNQRPHLHEFLQQVSSRFETHLFTAAVPIYADPVLDRLDPDRSIFAKRWYRADCSAVMTPHAPRYAKDLTRLGGDPSRVVLVDNNPDSFRRNPENGILVPSFTHDPNDDSLLEVLGLLKELDGQTDVRPTLEEKFQLREQLGL